MTIGIEVHPNLYVGDEADVNDLIASEELVDWYILHAAKLPWHKDFCGYTGRAAPKDHEYYAARRGNRMALNLIDVDNPDYMPEPLFAAATNFITEGLVAGKRVLVHCNQGASRAPCVALVWLRDCAGWGDGTFEEAEEKLRSIYPAYAPANGPRQYARRQWDRPAVPF